jgi:hypothetical protein
VETRRLSVYSLHLACRLWNRVFSLAVTGITISSRVFRRDKVTVFQRHRLLIAGNRRDIRFVSYSGKTPTFCVFPVFSVAVMEKCCDACGDGEYYFGRVFRRYRVTVFQWHRLLLTGFDGTYRG